MLRLSLLWGFALILMPALLTLGWWVRKRAIRWACGWAESGLSAGRGIIKTRTRDGGRIERRSISRSSCWSLEIVSSRVLGLSHRINGNAAAQLTD